MREREQGGQQWHRIGLGEAIVAKRVLEFLEPCGGSIFSRKLQHPVQVFDNRIESTALVIG